VRILRLDLRAFGPFTDQSLNFGDGAGLFIVYGANEAGKSSSLRALKNLLYGIKSQTSDDFVHSYTNLRIGGVFEAANGTRVECIRRKARTATLRGPDDVEVYDESQLLRLLAGVDETAYKERFGIDYQELRRGGNAIVQGGGELGDILFAAGAGMADIRAIQKRFETEADSLFKPRGSNQRIGQSLVELEQVRKEIRDSQLSTTQWIEHDRELRKAEKRQREIDEELTHQRMERNRLDRIRQSLPLIGTRNPLRKALVDVATARLLPEGFEAERREVVTKLSIAVRDEARARQEIERLEGELRSVSVPVALLKHSHVISRTHTELGSHQKAARDRPGLVAERNKVLKDAETLCLDLSQPTTLDQVNSLRLPKAKRRRIQELASDGKALMERQASSEQSLRELDERIRLADERLNGCPPPRNLSELDRVVRQIQKSGDLEFQLSGNKVEIEHLKSRARVELSRLPLYRGTLKDLESLPIPSPETIDRFERDLSEVDEEFRRQHEKVEGFGEETQSLQARLEALRIAGEVPTEVELGAMRQRRNSGWNLVLQVWRENLNVSDPTVIGFVEEFVAGGDLRAAFEASMEHADVIADRLRREADRVAERAKLTADLQQVALRSQMARRGRMEAEERREQLWREWQAHWSAAHIVPLTPREMRSWRNQQQELVGIAADTRRREADLQRLVDQIDSMRGELNRCLEILGESVVVDQTPFPRFLDYCQSVADEIRQENVRRGQLEQEGETHRGQRPGVEQAANESRDQMNEWRAEWAAAVSVLGLDGQATPTEANSLIETVDELIRLWNESVQLDVRIRGIDEDADHFKHSVRLLIEQAAPELLDTLTHSVDRSVTDLVVLLDHAVKDQAKVDGWKMQLQSQKTARDSALADITLWQQRVDAFCILAGCQSPEELPQAEERSAARRRTESELLGIEHRLCELASGISLEEWITTAEHFDVDRVQVDITGLDDAIRLLEDEKQRVSESLGEHRNELSRMDGSDKAAESQAQAEGLLATIRRSAEEYVLKRLASKVLAQAIDRFRVASQGPVLSRASELFSTLTLGAFCGLRADADDNGRMVLVGVRSGGQTVGVAGMSEGTCDQIYLALRISLLESALIGREPLPFIVDDVLVMFDDKRTSAALQVLSQFSEQTQVILFTHHEHLVHIARETLDDRSLTVLRI